MKFRIVFSLLLCAVFGFAQPSQAGAWRLGGGGQSVGFGDDLDDVDRGFGVFFSGAFQHGSISLDLQLGSSGHDENRADELAFYSYAMIGAKYSFSSSQVQPYIAGDLTLNSVEFDELDTISGEGVYWGIGADILISENHAISVSYRVSEWDGEDDVFDYDVSNSYFGVAYNFRFSP